LFREFSSKENDLELLRLGETNSIMLETFVEGQKHQFNKQMVMSSKRKNWICSHEKDDVS
jgi:hypothetical protein